MNKEASLKSAVEEGGGDFSEKKESRADIFKILDEEKKKIIYEIEEDYKAWVEGKTERMRKANEYVILDIESGDFKEEEKDVVEEYVNLINKDIRRKYCECLERYALEKMPEKNMDQDKEIPVPRPLGADVARKIDSNNMGENNMENPIFTSAPSVDDLLNKVGNSQLASVNKGKPEDSERKKTVKKNTGGKKVQPVSDNGNKKRKPKKIGGEGGLADLEKIELKEQIDQKTKDFIDSMFEAMGANATAIDSVKKMLEGRTVNMDENQKKAILEYVDGKIPKDTGAENPKSIVENFLKENGVKAKEGKGRTKKECIFFNDSDPGMYFYIYSVENSGKINIWDQRDKGRQSYITLEELKELMKTYHQEKGGKEKDENFGKKETKNEPIQEIQKTEESAVQKKEASEEISADEFFKKYGDKYRDRKKFFPENDFGSWMIVSGFDEKEGMVKVSFESIDKKSGKIIGSGGKMTVPNFEKTIKKYSLSEKEMEERKNEREKNAKKQTRQKTDNEREKAVMTKDEFEGKFKHIFGKNFFEYGKKDGKWIYIENAESYNENTGEVKILLSGKFRKITPERLEKMLEIYKEIESKSGDAGKGESVAEEKEEVLLKKETMGHFLEFARKFEEQCRALKWEGYENDMDIVERAIKIEMKKFLRKSVKEVESDEEKQEKIIEFILNSFKK